MTPLSRANLWRTQDRKAGFGPEVPTGLSPSQPEAPSGSGVSRGLSYSRRFPLPCESYVQLSTVAKCKSSLTAPLTPCRLPPGVASPLSIGSGQRIRTHFGGLAAGERMEGSNIPTQSRLSQRCSRGADCSKAWPERQRSDGVRPGCLPGGGVAGGVSLTPGSPQTPQGRWGHRPWRGP